MSETSEKNQELKEGESLELSAKGIAGITEVDEVKVDEVLRDNVEVTPPDSLSMTYYDINSMILDLFDKFKLGYIPKDLNCISRRGRAFTVRLVQEAELKRLLREEREAKQAEIDERTELRRLASLAEEAEELTITNINDDGKETLDDSTKAILDIDWDLLDAKALEGDKDFIKKVGLKHSIKLSKAKKPEGMVSDLREAIENL